MGVIVPFDFTTWSELFPAFVTSTPQFTALTEPQVVNLILPIAEQYNRNDGGGPVNNAGVQTQLLNLMVAHVAQLMFGSATQPLSPLVGRISNATEGSVSVATDFPTTPGNAWFVQTQWGAMWWQMALPYRLGRYRAKITPQVQAINGARGFW
ncbi:DUF4054 domain-containing protein [Bradyrhizobium genosp. L]|uniref:DUF4054 domain-containing protein n=1 Tax=Bradyrhizobium genosp. L TaxID=83637 RepID=UPI0018A2DB4E|nr:DUF4054 domain-containing protein [Bradyrhizobium genosp. L]QPF81670.1 DUF4054 domain-containing protein [Bradyrhizobium genosp. L]